METALVAGSVPEASAANGTDGGGLLRHGARECGCGGEDGGDTVHGATFLPSFRSIREETRPGSAPRWEPWTPLERKRAGGVIAMSKGSGRAKGCLSCLGLALCFVFIGAGIPMGLIVAGVGVHDRFAADRPIMCGDDVMPDDDRYVCSGGTSSTYEGLLEDRRDQVEQAPYTMVIGFSLAALGALALLITIWFPKAPGPQDPKSTRAPTRDRPGPPP